jgi:peroxiredoxin
MNKMKVCLIFFTSIILALNGLTQNSSVVRELIPKEYEKQFKNDSRKYLEYTNPSGEVAGKAYNLWQNVVEGYLKSYNKDSLEAVYDSLSNVNWLRQVEFIKLNPSSYASLYYFNQRFIVSARFRPDSLHNIYLSLDKAIKATPLGRSVAASIMRKQSLQLNLEMPDFSFRTTDARTVSLSDFRGKNNVLICFWASWCNPCVRNIPFLKQIEEAYRGRGLQVISISIDKDSTKWHAALEKYNMPWLQTCDLPDYTNNNRLSTLYEIHFIPQYFLIDKGGILIYQDVLNGENDDHTVLKEALKKVFIE